ncbi:hypothetical protein K7432_012631 [Basidiobolus ranarum]|uniref:Cytochrome P450 n=1 Tax=Basidiobolus ranarum TaxID=34480 RepID=A0ABR2WKH4_9FUNG
MADLALHTLPNSPYYEGLYFLSITNLLTTRDPQVHSEMRRQVTTVFTTKSLSLSEHLFTECTVAWCKRMVKATESGETFDMTRLCWENALNIMGGTAFGTKLVAPLLDPSKKTHSISRFFTTNSTTTYAMSDPPHDFMQMAVEAERKGGKLGKEQKDNIVKTMRLFMLAGMETTASILSIIFKQLAEHPAELATLQSEMDELYADSMEFTKDDFEVLPSGVLR